MPLHCLTGKNLGTRHFNYNLIVNEAYKTEKDNTSIALNKNDCFPNQSPLNRMFKIDLASKLRNLDYIIENLKDADMLYVTRALKSTWLLESEFKQIINPQYLEVHLYPYMTTTAITKMKHWIYLNLQDEERCFQFYSYYYETNFRLAIKFLRRCSGAMVLRHYPLIMKKISVFDLKILCEKSSHIIKIFFDSLATDEELKMRYLANEKQYFDILKRLLKVNPGVILDIVETYFNCNKIKHFSPKATKFIMKNYKQRYLKKPELYTAFLLDLNTLTKCLTREETLNLITQLAKDKYLVSQNWFCYKNVEPLIKSLKPEERGAIKRHIFIDKNFGVEVKEWPYNVPSAPVLVNKISPIFEDEQYSNEYCYMMNNNFRSMLKKKKYAKWSVKNSSEKTMLDKLFKQYRVACFDKTLYELRKRLTAESSSQNRQYIMLVLISKSGGRQENIDKLMQLLIIYINEPSQIRAALIRSLVKRAQIWRIGEETWNILVKFSHGLGLDGNPPETACIEIIHAAVIRQMVLNHNIDPAIFTIFMENFSTLVQYTLSSDEKGIISNLLPALLFTNACAQIELPCAVNFINKLLDTLTAFRLPIEQFCGLISKIKSLAEIDLIQTQHILKRLYKANIARRELFKVNFNIMDSEHSFINGLRHDTEILSAYALIKLILEKQLKYDRFFRKLSIYFGENDGLSMQFLNAIKDQRFQKALARPLCILIGDKFETYLKIVDNSTDAKSKIYAAALRANALLARPAFDIDAYGWNILGAKAIANRVIICRDIELNNNIKILLTNRHTIKLGVILGERRCCNTFIDVFSILASVKPVATIKLGLNILRQREYNACLEVWNIVKLLLEKLDITALSKKHLRIHDIASLPIKLRPEYSVIVYKIFKSVSPEKTMPILCHIEKLLSNVDEEFIENVLLEFLSDFLPTKINDDDDDNMYFYIDYACLQIRMLIKFLLVTKSITIQNQRLKSICDVLFCNMQAWQISRYKTEFDNYFEEILIALRYHEVFLNTAYVCCLPVMEKIDIWMKTILPMETHFKQYVHMNLNIIYYKAIRKSMTILNKKYFDDIEQEESRKLVGNVFGKYIAQEVEELKGKYFDSATYLYKDIIICLKHHFIHDCEIFTESLLNGILDFSKSSSHILAAYILKETYFRLKENVRVNILNRLKCANEIDVQMILFAVVI